jgi:xanthine dehydrogenase accessory factor
MEGRIVLRRPHQGLCREGALMRLDLLSLMNGERQARRAVVLVTDLASGTQRLVRGFEVGQDPLADEIDAAIRAGKSKTLSVDNKSYFLTVQVPAIRLLIIGAVHIGQALAPMAKIAGFDVTIIDPRSAFATPERFPDVPVIAEWPDTALPALGLDRYTAMAFFTHDPKIDDPGLVLALRAQCFYIGALGSRKTHAKRVERMLSHGIGDEAINRIHAPIGLDIGAESPSEIAVSVLGEIVASLRKKPLRSAAEKTGQAALTAI